MPPAAFPGPVDGAYRDTGEIMRQIVGHAAAGEADDDQDAAGAQEVAHAGQPGGGVHVVQYGHRRDEVERRGFERVSENVAEYVVDVVRVTACLVDAGGVEIDRGDVRDRPPRLAGEMPSPQPASRACRAFSGIARRMRGW